MASLKKRNKVYYAQFYLGKKQKRVSLNTESYQVAKEKLRQLESSLVRGEGNPLPTRTPIADVLTAYVEHIRIKKTAKSAQTDVYYLREAFGPICDAVRITSRTPSEKARKRKSQVSQVDRRRKLPVIEAGYLEDITTAQVAQFIDFKVRDQGIKPKTANHYRSIIRRVINWAIEYHGIRLPNNINPTSKVRPYKEAASEIRFLTLAQIDEQLHGLRFKPQLQTMVATLIYAGLRREELLWLTVDDIDQKRRLNGQGLIRVRAKSIDGHFWQPKTKKNRAVPISRKLREYMGRYSPPPSIEGWYFPSSKGGWWDPDNFARDLRVANRENLLHWSCLDYRHTFGSQLAQNGVSLYKIATLLGNSPAICQRHYAALIPEGLAVEVEFGKCLDCFSSNSHSSAS